MTRSNLLLDIINKMFYKTGCSTPVSFVILSFESCGGDSYEMLVESLIFSKFNSSCL